jgi:hypothetical protein
MRRCVMTTKEGVRALSWLRGLGTVQVAVDRLIAFSAAAGEQGEPHANGQNINPPASIEHVAHS